MGEGSLPLAVEFALRCMRLGEVSRVAGPAAYAAPASPLSGRSLRGADGRLPPAGRVPRKLRFLPAAPPELVRGAREARGIWVQGGGKSAGPRFSAEVELVGLEHVQVLTEDRRVAKRLLRPGSGRRTPRLGDLVSFSLAGAGHDGWHSMLLGDALPLEGLQRVLLSMREGELCLARMPGLAGAALELQVELHRWRCRDSLALGPGPEAPKLQRLGLRPGPERFAYEVEEGSLLLVAVACTGRPHLQTPKQHRLVPRGGSCGCALRRRPRPRLGSG